MRHERAYLVFIWDTMIASTRQEGRKEEREEYKCYETLNKKFV